MRNIPVYVRRIDDPSDRRFLGRVHHSELEELVRLYKFWGCFDGDDVQNDNCGQFFISNGTTTGFEIIVGDMQ